MKKLIERTSLMLLGAVIIVSAQLIVSSKDAHAASKVAYKVIQINQVSECEMVLNDEASQGWSYVGSAASGMLIFKR